MHLNTGQYVVPWLNFSCSGSITAWEFAASVQDDETPWKQVILQLWQPLPSNINPSSSSEFSLVRAVVLSTSIDGTFNRESAIRIDLSQPLPVSSGNVLGFSVLNSERGLRFAAVTASGMADRVFYSRLPGGGSGGGEREDRDAEEGSSYNRDDLFRIDSNVYNIPTYSPAMTIDFITGTSLQCSINCCMTAGYCVNGWCTLSFFSVCTFSVHLHELYLLHTVQMFQED